MNMSGTVILVKTGPEAFPYGFIVVCIDVIMGGPGSMLVGFKDEFFWSSSAIN